MNKPIQIVLTISILLVGCSGKMPQLGIEDGQLTQCPTTPNCVNSQAQSPKHFIEPILIEGKSFEAQSHILEILRELNRVKIIVADDNYIRAEFTSRIFRFVDDVEFYLPDAGSKETIIHVRSASRRGISDFGVNRKRIETIRSRLKAINTKTACRMQVAPK